MANDIDTNFSIEGEETPVLPTESDAEIESEGTPPPLWKQAAGAVAGALIALTLYTIYEAVTPVVTAFLSPTEHAEEQTVHGTDSAHVSTSARKQRGAQQE